MAGTQRRGHPQLRVAEQEKLGDGVDAGLFWIRQLAEGMDEGLAVTDASRNEILYVSPVYAQLTGRSCESLYRNPDAFRSAIHPDDRERVTREVRRIGQQSFNQRFRFLRPDGSVRRICGRGTAIRDETGAVVRVAWVARDVTELEELNDALRDSHERYRVLLELSSDCAYCFHVKPDGELALEWVSSAIAPIAGISTGELDSRVLERAVSPDDLDRLREGVSKALSQRDPVELEFPVITKKEKTLRIRARYRSVHDEASSVVRIMGVAKDISERKHAEEQRDHYTRMLESDVSRREAQLERMNAELRRLRSRLSRTQGLGGADSLAASVAYCINNPLTALIGTAEMSIEAASRADPAMAQVLRLGHRIRDVVDRTLRLFRDGSLALETEDPGKILAGVRDELVDRARERDVGIELRIEARLPALSVDPSMLCTSLTHIAENGLEASPDGATLWLEVSALPAERGVRFRIMDQGPGIPAEVRQRIFEPFFTTKPMAVGLGLAIARAVVQSHRGRILLDERPEGGVRATIEIPLHPDHTSLP